MLALPSHCLPREKIAKIPGSAMSPARGGSRDELRSDQACAGRGQQGECSRKLEKSDYYRVNDDVRTPIQSDLADTGDITENGGGVVGSLPKMVLTSQAI